MRGRRMSLDFSQNPRSHGPTFCPGKTELPHLYCFALQSIILVGGFEKNLRSSALYHVSPSALAPNLLRERNSG